MNIVASRGRRTVAWIFVVIFSFAQNSIAENTANADPSDVSNIVVIDKQYRDKTTANVTKLATPTLDLPFSIEIIDADVLNQYGNGSLSTLLGATSSALVNASEGGRANEILLRGFTDTAVYRNGINESFAARPPRNLVHVERIEILKGPSSALYGPGEPGGAVNYITKQPEATQKATISAALGSRSLSYFDFDTTGPLLNLSNVNYRIIGSRQQSDSFRDFVKSDNYFLTAGLDWYFAPQQKLGLSVEYTKQEGIHDTGVLGSAFGPISSQRTFFGEPMIGAQDLYAVTAEVRGSFQLSHQWQLDTIFNYQQAGAKGDAIEPSEVFFSDNESSLSRELQTINDNNNALVGQFELSGSFTSLGVNHRLLIGLETTHLAEEVQLAVSDDELNPFAVSISAPTYNAALPMLKGARNSNEDREQYSLYAQDLFSFGKKWRLLLSARFDSIAQSGSDSVSGTSFSNTMHEVNPRVGIVYLPSSTLAFYASYSQSLDPNEGLKPSGRPLAPTRGKAVELGTKWHVAEDKLIFNLSAFRIKQTDVTTDAPGQPGFEIQTARQTNTGLDFSIESNPFDWLRVYANYNYINSEITDDPEVLDGTPALNVPRHRFSLLGLVHYGWIKPKDTSVGLNLSYIGTRQGSLEPAERLVEIGEYTRADAFISHHFSEHLALSLRIENLTNTNYIQNSQSDALHWTVGKPRTFVGQLRFAF